MRLNSLDEILRFAIRKEADAAAFYRMAADRSDPGVKKTFEELAKEEEGHKKKLEGFDLKKIEQMELKETKGLGMSEMMEDVPYSSDMSYADLLRMAIKNEEKSQKLYTSTSQIVTGADVKKIAFDPCPGRIDPQREIGEDLRQEILKEF